MLVFGPRAELGESKTQISPVLPKLLTILDELRQPNSTLTRAVIATTTQKRRDAAASHRESLLRGLVSAAPECFLPGPAEPHGGDDQTDH
jgi:hypothetical protein